LLRCFYIRRGKESSTEKQGGTDSLLGGDGGGRRGEEGEALGEHSAHHNKVHQHVTSPPETNTALSLNPPLASSSFSMWADIKLMLQALQRPPARSTKPNCHRKCTVVISSHGCSFSAASLTRSPAHQCAGGTAENSAFHFVAPLVADNRQKPEKPPSAPARTRSSACCVDAAAVTHTGAGELFFRGSVGMTHMLGEEARLVQ